MMGKISEFMLKQHVEILNLFDQFIKTKNIEDFEILKVKQGHHIYAEEQAIFTFYKYKKNFPVLVKILKQHQELEELMGKLSDNLKLNRIPFRNLLVEHTSLEDREFYPILDGQLTSQEQEKLLNEAKKLI